MATKIHALPESVTPKIIARFYATIHEPNENGCRLWKGRTDRDGYGRATFSRGISRDFQRAHRLAWVIANGTVPDGMVVCHSCDVRLCCEASHLFIGTQADNMADMKAKRRGAIGDKHSSKTHPELVIRGERHVGSKLVESDIRAIRRMMAPGCKVRGTTTRVAERFGIDRALVARIAAGTAWAHVPLE